MVSATEPTNETVCNNNICRPCAAGNSDCTQTSTQNTSSQRPNLDTVINSMLIDMLGSIGNIATSTSDRERKRVQISEPETKSGKRSTVHESEEESDNSDESSAESNSDSDSQSDYDERWETFVKLLDSHRDLTRAFLHLVREE